MRHDKKDDLMRYWKRFLSGDDNALSIIYKMLVHDLFSFGKTMTPDDELVKDSIQDVFIWVLQKKTQLTQVNNIQVYLLIALKNTLYNAFKKKQDFERFMALYEPEELMDESEEDRIIASESDRILQDWMDRYKSTLTKRQQEIIHYRFVDDLTIEEISELLNINYQSVANIIQRALKKIRAIYLKK